MPRRANISALFVLIGTLTGSAAQFNVAAQNTPFQPRSSLPPAVVRPRQSTILGAKQWLAGIEAQKITPLLRAPAAISLTRTAFNQPSGAKVRPVVVKAAGNH